MENYYNQLEKEIQSNKKELEHLRQELDGLRSTEKDTPRESYQHQYENILSYMYKEQQKLDANRKLKDSYDKAKESIIEVRKLRNDQNKPNEEVERYDRDLANLRTLLSHERDFQIRDEISREITAKENEQRALQEKIAQELADKIESTEERITTNIGNLTEELANELRQSFLATNNVTENSENRENNSSEDIENPTEETELKEEANETVEESTNKLTPSEEYKLLQEEYSSAELAYLESINEFLRIFAEEADRKINGDLFKTTEELDDFKSEYMRQKVEENERFESAKARMIKAKEKMAELEASGELEFTPPKVENEDTIKIEKQGEAIAKKLEEDGIISRGIDKNKTKDKARSTTTEDINIIYGQEKSIKAGDFRTTSITEKQKENVQKHEQEQPMKKVPHSQEKNNTNKEPTAAPIGIPINNHNDKGTYSLSHDNIIQDDLAPNEKKHSTIIKRGFNANGTYRLFGSDIIQDDLSKNKKKIFPIKQKKKDESAIKPIPADNPNNNIKNNKEQNISESEISDDKVKKQHGKDTKTVNLKPEDQPKKEKDSKTDKIKTTPKRGLLTIMDELTEGLQLKKTDGNRYTASNIKVARNFAEELKSGNYLYNVVHLVPAIVKLPIQTLKKSSAKIMLRKSSKENIEILRDRIDKLSEDDLMTIYHEYRGSRVVQERFPSILNTLLDEKVQKFALSKISKINSELEERYKSAYHAIRQIEAIDVAIRDKTKTPIEKTNLRKYRTALLNNQGENISKIREKYVEANEWLSGGAHGFSEDMKAAATKLSCVGKRFAKDYDLDRELLHKQAQLEKAELKAIADGNNEMALRTFIQSEVLLSSSTEISNSIYGKRSTGKKYYSPLAEQLDYRPDPFVRDIFATVALTSAAVSAVRSIQTHTGQNDILKEQEEIMARNNTKMDQVNQIGRDISGKRDQMMKGIASQSNEANLNASNIIERAELDYTGWKFGPGYHNIDKQGHEFYNNFYEATQTQMQEIASRYAQGTITQQEAMDAIVATSANCNETLNEVTKACLDILTPYAKTHPQFDLTAVEESMKYLQNNPTAIMEMNQAMVDVTNSGDVLQTIQLEQLAPLSMLPSDLNTTLFAAASSAALATKVEKTLMQGKKQGKYGNEVTAMVEEYATSHASNIGGPTK